MFDRLNRWFPGRRRLVLPVLAVVLVVGSLALAIPMLSRQARATATPGGSATVLSSHFLFGVMSGPGDTPYLAAMRSQNGTAWDERYQYLAGGANTGHGWATWNSPAGDFATYYMRDSDQNGFGSTFVYYQLLQSNGPAGSGEGATDLAHLADASTMAAYYADWRLLMQKIGSFGKPVLVIVEPDLWGFLEQAALAKGATSAAAIPASVASSGDSDAQGLPNTAQGFAWALLRIRSLYAPHAILALHASPWGSSVDIASDTDAGLDAAAIGQRDATFLATAGLTGVPSGIAPFDLLSNDIADHDSGQSGIWWDRNNVTYPNFARYLQYASALSAGTGRRIVMWQVPEGNQYFETENNSTGHTQDNKAEYILGHIADFANAGIVGTLFGPGNGGTSIYDSQKDSTTNPAPISTYECNGCDSHVSTYADDDGGYLRITVGAYYASGGYALDGSSSTPTPATTVTVTPTTSPTATTTATPTPTATATATPAGTAACASGQQPTISFGATSATPGAVNSGQSVTLSMTFTASCQATGLVDFEVYNASGTKVWQTYQDSQALTGSAQSFTVHWAIPKGQARGTYTFDAGVFSPGWGANYGWKSGAASITIKR